MYQLTNYDEFRHIKLKKQKRILILDHKKKKNSGLATDTVMDG